MNVFNMSLTAVLQCFSVKLIKVVFCVTDGPRGVRLHSGDGGIDRSSTLSIFI